MQHKNNNIAIAEALESITSSLSKLDVQDSSGSIAKIEGEIAHLDIISQETNAPELRALAHWTMLNIEQEPTSNDLISALLENGSYYHWMEILSSLLREYDQSLLPKIYKALTEPKWVVKPSAPLLRNLAGWIEVSKNASEPDILSDELIINDEQKEFSDQNTETTSEINVTPPHVFEEVEVSVLEKNYCGTNNVPKEFNDTTDSHSLETEKSSNYYTDIEEENEEEEVTLEASSNEEFIAISDEYQEINEEELLNEVSDINNEVIAESSVEDSLLETLNERINNDIEVETVLIDDIEDINEDSSLPNTNTIDTSFPEIPEIAEDDNDFNDEIEDIVMTLASTSAITGDVFDATENHIAELERLTMLAEISGYSKISPVSLWCERNLKLFAENKSDESRAFIESGECWIWIELINIALNEPEEISHISQLSAELSRDEWLEPLGVSELQELLLFIRNPEMNDNDSLSTEDNNNAITHAPEIHSESIVNSNEQVVDVNESSEYSFTWDEDTHPELLEAYFEETSGLIKEASLYLSSIGTTETTKEERQNATRTVHTIKGGSAVVGITALSEFAYKLEQIFDHSIDHKLSDDANTLLNSTAQTLEDIYKAIEDKKTAPESFASTFSGLTGLAESLDDDDDVATELDAPVLPDFITQQNSNDIDDIDDIKATENIEIDEIVIDETIESIQEEFIDKELEVSVTNNEIDLDEELIDFSTELDDIVMTLMTTEMNESTEQASLYDNHIAELQRLDVLAEISGFPEVSKVSNWCQHNLELFAQDSSNESREFISSGESWSWIELISACLTDPDEISHISSLSAELMRDDWSEALDIEDLQNLLLLLKSSNDDEDEASTNETTDQLTSDDKINDNESLDDHAVNIVTWDDDVHPELLAVYLQETTEQVSKVAVLLHKISKGEADKEEHKLAARIAHTIKGASGVVGISEIVDLTHKLEDILDYSVENKLPEETAELLSESSDCLESLFESVENKTSAPEEFDDILARLTEYSSSLEDVEYNNVYEDFIALDDPDLPDFINSQVLKETEKDTSSSFIDNEIIDITQKAIEASNNSSSKAAVETKSVDHSDSHIRVPVNLINRLLNLAGELVTTSTQVSDKVESSLVISTEIKSQDQRVHRMLKELSTTIYKQEEDQMSMLSSMQNKDFDSLEMDTYNELHSVASLLTESILDSETIERTLNIQLHEIQDDLRRFDQLNKELSDVILNSRMESLNTLIPRLERIVRQTCRKTDKKAELIVTGNDINIDTEILNGLVDPLLHMLRNAIDHGIEAPKARKAKNKDKTGKIYLDFSRQGNFIHMKLTDDGAGINPESLYENAIEKGLITPDQEYSKSEVLKLILQPGFTTHKNVTDISGRGVGMDVVNEGVKQLQGTLNISSEIDQGTSIKIKIPLTLVTSSTLLVSTAGNQVAIPTDTIEQIYYLSPEDVLNRNGEQFIRHLGNEIAITSLAGILGWPLQNVDFSKAQTLLLIKGDTELHAIHIDEIIHSREVVIKSLAHFINSSKGVIGACHLTDGAVAPVIHLPSLLSLNETSNFIIKEHQDIDESIQNTHRTPQILVVDDSLSNRKALSLIIGKTDYDVITAVDGLDALNIMNEQHIDMVFTDLEMPRMTGLELTQSIRAWNDKKHIPVVMITSRSTNKHRQLAEKAGVDDYLTKPVGTDTLLESMETWLKQEAVV